MRWTILATTLVIEGFKNKIISKKFSTTNADTKGMWPGGKTPLPYFTNARWPRNRG